MSTVFRELRVKIIEIIDHNLDQFWVDTLTLINPTLSINVRNAAWIVGVGGTVLHTIRLVESAVSQIIFRECVDRGFVNRDSGLSIEIL